MPSSPSPLPPLPVSLLLPPLSPPLSMPLPSPSHCHHHRRRRHCRHCCHRYRYRHRRHHRRCHRRRRRRCHHCRCRRCHHRRRRRRHCAIISMPCRLAARRPPCPPLHPLFHRHILPLLIVECLPNQSYCPSTLMPSFPTHPPSISANIPPTPSVFACSEKLHFFALSHRANYLCCRGTRVKPSARVIAHGVGMRSMHLIRASPMYGRW